MGNKLQINYNEGDTFQYVLYFRNSSNEAIDKTGKTYDFTIKDTPNGTSLVSETGVVPTDASNGEVTITVASTTMVSLSEGEYAYSIKEVDGATVFTKLYGSFMVKNTV